MILFGETSYGRVDHIPGLFYVETRFLHVCFFPLVPRNSLLMFDDASQQGSAIPIAWKSVFVGWLRAICFLVMTIGYFGLFGLLAAVLEDSESDTSLVLAAIEGSIFVVFGVALWCTFKVGTPTRERAVELGRHLQIPRRIVEEYFAGRGLAFLEPLTVDSSTHTSTPQDEVQALWKKEKADERFARKD